MSDLFPITDADKLACVEREIKFRTYVYPRRIDNGTMTQERADREIAIMESIREDYKGGRK